MVDQVATIVSIFKQVTAAVTWILVHHVVRHGPDVARVFFNKDPLPYYVDERAPVWNKLDRLRRKQWEVAMVPDCVPGGAAAFGERNLGRHVNSTPSDLALVGS